MTAVLLAAAFWLSTVRVPPPPVPVTVPRAGVLPGEVPRNARPWKPAAPPPTTTVNTHEKR